VDRYPRCLVASAGLTLIIGWPTFKLRGHYFALATIAIPTCCFYLAKYFKNLTRGSEGISVIFRPGLENMMFSSKIPWYYLTFALLLLALGLLWKIKHSKLMFYFLAIKEDEISAAAAGINPVLYKQIALTLSVIFISVMGPSMCSTSSTSRRRKPSTSTGGFTGRCWPSSEGPKRSLARSSASR